MAKQIVARVPDELHLAVKIKAAREGKSMTQVILELLENWTSDDKETERDADENNHLG